MKQLLKTFVLVLVGAVAGALLVVSFTPKAVDKTQTFGDTSFNRIESGVTTTFAAVASASSTSIMSANSGRVYASLVNTCNYDVYVALGTTAVKGSGILLNAHGGSYEILPDNGYIGQISGIASTSDGTDTCNIATEEKQL